MFKLNSEQNKSLQEIANKSGLKFIIAFGSYAEEKQTSDSDFDIAVYLNNPNTFNFKIFEELFFLLSKVFAGQNLDLSILNNADSLFRYEVTRKGQLLYGDELEYLEFKSFAFKEYLDSAKLRSLEGYFIVKRQKALKELLK